MPAPTTPTGLAKELGVSPKTVRQYCRDQGWQSVPYTRWDLSPGQVRQVREHFAR